MSQPVLTALMAASALLAGASLAPTRAKITVRVLDERLRPVSGSDVGVSFELPRYKAGVWGSSDVFTKRGVSDHAGLFAAEHKAGFFVHCGAGGAGYYRSLGKIEFKTEKWGRYQPWNPTVELIVKRIINPIPMYGRRLEREVPVLNEPVGFDFLGADWAAPNGQAKSNDILFKITKRVVSFHDFDAELIVSFPNKGDGIALMVGAKGGSELRSLMRRPRPDTSRRYHCGKGTLRSVVNMG